MSLYNVENQTAVVQGFGYSGDLSLFVPSGVRQFEAHHGLALEDVSLGIALPRQLTEGLAVSNRKYLDLRYWLC